MKDEEPGGAVSYAVRIGFADREKMEGFVTWLRERHIADVCAAGAEDAELVRLDSPTERPFAVEVRYRFPSRDAFVRYEREEAPRLRAEGLAALARLGVSHEDVTFVRTTGVVLDWRSR